MLAIFFPLCSSFSYESFVRLLSVTLQLNHVQFFQFVRKCFYSSPKVKKILFKPHLRKEVWRWHTQQIPLWVLVASNGHLGDVRWRAEMQICTSVGRHQVANIFSCGHPSSGTIFSIILREELGQREAPSETLTTVV